VIRQLSALLIFFSLLLSAQNKAGVQLKRDWKSSKIFKGSIAGKPITLNLEYATHSGWNDKVYSVQGYYYYDTFKQKIPLAGFIMVIYCFTISVQSIRNCQSNCLLKNCSAILHPAHYTNLSKSFLRFLKTIKITRTAHFR